ncbi:hypothetical protein M0802_002411 [Mischocyttarus mexicanus]|nr:hypothetical protein M0802_002411 [Mischocyttarus mexicanus]
MDSLSTDTQEPLSTGKKREDRGEQSKHRFDSLNLEVKYPGTAILLLQCQENTILLNAAAALSKYATKSQENINLLFDLNIVKSIIPLINHQDLFTRRFAAKLLAEMTAIPYVRNFLLESDYYIPHFVKVLINENDLFMQEFSSMILAELSKDVYGVAQLLEQCPNMNFLYERIQSVDPDVKKNNIEIIYNLIQDPIGAQKIINSQDFNFPLIYRLLEEPYPEIQGLTLNVIGDLLSRNKDEYTQNIFRETKGLEALLNFLDNDDWHDLHSEVLKLLSLASDNHKTVELLDNIGGIQRIYKYMENTLNSKLFADAFEVVIRLADIPVGRKQYLTWLIKQPYEKVLLETQLIAVKALIAIGHHTTLRNSIIKIDTIDALCTPFEAHCPTMDEFKVLCCQALSMFCIDKIGRDAFLKIHGPSRLHHLLSDVHSIPIRNAAVQLVQLLCVDPVLANVFVQTKYLSYMLNNRTSARIIPSWDTCIETLFNSHLPAKFAFTGRLSLHDITKDGFYVLQHNVCPFPVLNDIFRFKFCPLEPVYVVNTAQSNYLNDTINDKDIEEARNSIQIGNASKGVFLSAETVNGWLELILINEEPNLVNICAIASRAKMLAKFVARQMSGPDPKSTCVDHQLEIHLREIKESIGTSVIPLGQLRVGSYLERAILFKVLADRICLPTALVRGEYGIAWVEIAIPQIEVPNEDTCFTEYLMNEEPCTDWIVRRISLSEDTRSLSKKLYSQIDNGSNVIVPWKLRQPILPTKLMKPNVIVDLIEIPGRFIPIDSELAKSYKSKEIICDLTITIMRNKR